MAATAFGKAASALRRALIDYWLIVFVIVGLVLYAGMRTFWIEPFRMPSRSMEPTLTQNTLFLVSKWGYGNYEVYTIPVSQRPRSARVARGDVIVFRVPPPYDARYVKRVIGLPGDHVRYVDHRLTVNGREAPLSLVEELGGASLYEEELDGVRYRVLLLPGGGRDFEGVVPPGHYFLMGDSRDNSRDSRYIGHVPEQDIIGKLAWVLFRPPMGDY